MIKLRGFKDQIAHMLKVDLEDNILYPEEKFAMEELVDAIDNLSDNWKTTLPD